ncbi:flavodoxin-like protein [Roseibium hamelinense]|uniref:Flavodoxin-like protein n=1 Tax=Roseibium hamelinense TaxID=150831 RepID=A0A562SM97_9HYPH|nr:flavodoxin-like protein [Roseibium hamelinense]
MNVLVVYCHPCPESFNATIRDIVLETLRSSGHSVRLLDLYEMGFDPVMNAKERRSYHDSDKNTEPVRLHVEAIKWCDGLVFVYPTWWFGLPAMLKGWLDRVWVPHATFEMPTATAAIQSKMQHIN